jgi:hypothetical protein
MHSSLTYRAAFSALAVAAATLISSYSTIAQDTSSLQPGAPAAGAPTPAPQPPAATFDADGWVVMAKARFMLPTADRVNEVKSELLAARDQLKSELTQFPDGMAIAKELELPTYEELAEKPSLEHLDKIILSTRLARDRRVQPSIDSVRRALRDFRATVLLAADANAAAKFSKAIELLASSMKNIATDPMPNYRELIDAYKYLSETRLMDDLLPPIRQRFSHINQRLVFSQKFLDHLADQEIKETRDINDNQDGMQLTGVSHIVAVPTAAFTPNDARAAVAVHLDAKVNSDITGYKHPATVFAHSVVNLTIDVPVYMSEMGVEAPEPLICAVSNSCLTGMCLHLKSRVLNRLLMPLAQKVAQKKLTESDPQVAEKARGEIGKMVADNREKMILQVNGLIQTMLWQSFEARDINANVRFRTTSSEMLWTAEYVGPGDLGSPTVAPTIPAEAEIGVQFHESTFNNTDVSVAGNKINEAIYREMLYDTFKFAPEDEDEDPSATRIPSVLTFADTEPLRLRFDDGVISGTLRLKAFSLNGKTYGDRLRSVRVNYKPQMTLDGFALNRQGDLEILDDGGANREEFEIALRRFFKAQFRSSTIKGPKSKVPLKVGGLTIEDGWISAFVVGAPK